MIRLAVRVARDHAELVLAELLDLAPGGVEEVDLDDGRIEFALYGAPGELPALPDVQATVASAVVEVTATDVPDDWAERWREFHKPIVIGDRVLVRPPWAAAAADGLIDIVIDPAQAFGTGAHPTTAMCIELLAAVEGRGSLLDVGCGSGVLAIAAAKLGFEPVAAVDNDRLSVEATSENARVNGVAVGCERFDLRRNPALPAADTVVANLLAPLMPLLAARIAHLPERLILSGLLHDQVDAAVDVFPLAEVDRRQRGDWSAVLLGEPSAAGVS